MTNSPEAAGCPFPTQTSPTTQTPSSSALSSSLTRRGGETDRSTAFDIDQGGVYRVHSFQASRDILRAENVKQAGFMIEAAQETGLINNQPVLFAEGDAHHEMRRDTAKYFTPAAVAQYQPMIAKLADELIAQLHHKREMKLDDLSLKLAVNVAAQVVGLTSSLLPGLEHRVIAFVEGGGDSEPGKMQVQTRLQGLQQQAKLAMFYFLDVKPAIEARKKQRRDDLISHLLDNQYSDVEIMTECLTYGTAGMVTTREFISVAAWHLIKHPDLRAEYVHGTEKQRHAILHEILRLEPVINTLYRRSTEDLHVAGQTIPEGSLMALNVQAANTDPAVTGADPDELCPLRSLPRGVQGQVLSFGDGHHRCPGAFLAIKESDVFLRRLLIWNDLRVVTPPTVSFNEVVKGYELRDFNIAIGSGKSA